MTGLAFSINILDNIPLEYVLHAYSVVPEWDAWFRSSIKPHLSLEGHDKHY